MLESKYLEENDRLVKSLKQIRIFKPFENRDLRELIKISKIRKYEAGEMIFKQNSYDTFLYFLIYGRIRVVRDGKLLTMFDKRGDIFGEMGAMDGSARSASVYADEEAACLATDTAYIEQLTGRNKIAFCYILYRVYSEVLAKRLRITSRELIKSKGIDWNLWG